MLIRVKVFPNSKKREVIRKSKDNFKINVKSKPEEGKANREVIKMLSCYLKIPESKIRLVKGFKQPNKIFEVSEND